MAALNALLLLNILGFPLNLNTLILHLNIFPALGPQNGMELDSDPGGSPDSRALDGQLGLGGYRVCLVAHYGFLYLEVLF